jgi:prevent-host-death family protein
MEVIMKTAAVSRLKASLSEYLAKVKAGEDVLVTDRGKPIAKIVPLKRDDLDMPPHLVELEHAGDVRIGSGKLPDAFWKFPRPLDKKGSALTALLKDRAESP